jgi:hypothetical protein
VIAFVFENLFDGSERLELVIFHLYVKYGIEMADMIECIVYIKERMENKNIYYVLLKKKHDNSRNQVHLLRNISIYVFIMRASAVVVATDQSTLLHVNRMLDLSTFVDQQHHIINKYVKNRAFYVSDRSWQNRNVKLMWVLEKLPL